SAVRGAVRDAARGARKAVRDMWYHVIGGAGWAAWPAAHATFYRDRCGIDLAPDVLAATEDATEPWWWWPHREYVIVSERPTVIRRDAAGGLHAEDGPAIAWPDGWGIYCWHGTRVRREWIEDRDAIDPSLALTWPLIEERRCL